MILIEHVLLIVALLLLFGILASKISSALGVPALLLFLLIGMLAGSEGPGGIPFDDPVLAQWMGILALAFILFAGGLDTDWKSVSRVAWQGLSLATLGVFLTAVLVGWFATFALGFSWLEGLLLGSIVSSTDAAAVFAILRYQSIGLKGRIRPLLELESGSNDPMAVFLTIGMIRLMNEPTASFFDLFVMFALQMGIGAALGYVIGRAAIWAINRIKLEAEGLYPVVTIAVVFFAYAGTTLLQGNGFLAVYLAGIVMGNGEFIQKRTLIRFHDGLAWLMQIAMFLVLGLLVFPSRIWPVAGVAIAVALFVMFIARPAAVFLSLLFAKIRLRSKVLISWIGLRGAVPIILATFPAVADIPNANMYFHVVFFIVITSVLFQGTSIQLVARWLGLDAPLLAKRQYPLEFVPTTKTDSDLQEIKIPDNSPIVGKRIMDLHLPESALAVLINRGDDFIAPRGGTVLERGDTLLVLASKKDFPEVRSIVQPRTGRQGAGIPDDEADA